MSLLAVFAANGYRVELLQSATRELSREHQTEQLAKYFKCLTSDIQLAYDVKGAPFVAKPERGGLFISRSHRPLCSGEVISALAFASQPMGVDVEIVQNHVPIPVNVLHPRERAFLQGLALCQRSEAFTKLWTLKEAYLKARGVGLSQAPESFWVEMCGEHARIEDATALTSRAPLLLSHRHTVGDEVVWVSLVVLSLSKIRTDCSLD
jgi:phosphopantetheinyl transferase